MWPEIKEMLEAAQKLQGSRYTTTRLKSALRPTTQPATSVVGSTLPGRAYSYLSLDQLQPRRRAGLFFVAFTGSTIRRMDDRVHPRSRV
jgi:hypothetical protein